MMNLPQTSIKKCIFAQTLHNESCISSELNNENKMKRVIAFAGLAVLALFRTPALAEEPVWCLVTDDGIVVEMSQVTCLVAADDETTFGIVLQDGTVMAGVRRVSFDRTIPTGIAKTEGAIFLVNKELGLEGIAPETPVSVFDTDGKLRLKGSARLISLAPLPAGIYIIQVNNTSFKIRKQ